jgi:hypothetical protein
MAVVVTDARSRSREYPVWKAVPGQYSWGAAESAADSSEVLTVSGTIRQISVTLNDNTNNVTATVALKDGSTTLYTTAAQPENATTITRFMIESGTDMQLVIPVEGTTTIVVTPSGAPGASGLTVDVKFFGT